MRKILFFLGIYLMEIVSINAQDTIKKIPFFIPKSTSINMNTNFHWFMYEGINGKWVDQMYISARLQYSNQIDIVVINKTKAINDNLVNNFSDFYINYRNDFKANDKIPIFKFGSYLDIKIGKLEWYPTFTNVQLIIENADKFINPNQIYGGSILSKTPLTRDKSLTVFLSAHTGDLIYNELDPELLDLYLNYTKIFKYNLGVSAQLGQFQGSKDLVNFVQLIYQPKLEKIQLDFKAGKLQTYEDTPYGIHIGFKRNFKYISLGGYFEKRFDQNTKGEIAGVQWSIIGPPKLVKFINTFNIFYDFNSTTLWMWIPVLKIDLVHK